MNSVEVLRGSLGLRYCVESDLSFDLDLNRDVVSLTADLVDVPSESFCRGAAG